MHKPRTALIAVTAMLAGGIASQLGSAQADNSTGATGTTGSQGTDTIVVNGSDTTTLPTGSSDSTVQSTYQTALGGALTDAGHKATFIATQIGATLGPITNVTETSTSSDLCQSRILFAPGAARPSTSPKNHKAKHGALLRTAIVEPIDNCTVEADVTVTYAMTPA